MYHIINYRIFHQCVSPSGVTLGQPQHCKVSFGNIMKNNALVIRLAFNRGLICEQGIALNRITDYVI